MTATVRRRDRSMPAHTGLAGPLRRSLLASSALVGSALLATQAQAQVFPLPVVNAAGGATISSSLPLDPPSLNINLNDASRIIDFITYDIAAGNSVNYSTTTAGMTDLVAVNRVLTGPLNTGSIINGTINATPGISVWLVNQEGIAFNGNAVLNGGSLMLSTLDFATDPSAPGSPMRANFAAAGAANATAFRFLTAAGNTSAITIGGNLTVAGSIVAVGQTITTDSALTAGNGSVVLVAASDVTFSNGLGNPLAFTVNAGTALGGAIEVNDDLTGRSVVVAGGMQDNLTAALLNIAPDATLTATAAGGTVTLATASTGDVGIVNGAGALPSIAMDGRLIADGAAGSVTVQSAADLTGTGTVLADGAVAIGAARNISVAGSSYTATNGALGVAAGRDVTLGALSAGTDVDVTARNVTLSGDVDAGGALGVVSTLDTTVDGTVTTDGDVSLTVLGATAISGDITAGGDYLLTRTTGLTQSGTVIADDNAQVFVTGAAQVTGSHEATTGALTINVGAAATLGALTAGTDIGLTTGGAATVSGPVDAGNDFTVRSGGNATLNGIVGADNDVVLSVGGGTFVNAALTAGRDFTVAGLVADDGTTGYTQSGSVTATRNVDLTVDGDALVTGALTATNGQVGATVGNDASFAAITAGTDIVISSVGAASFTGPIDAGNDFTVASGADTTLDGTVLTGNDVALAVGGATFVNAAVTAGRDVTVAGLVAGDGTTGYTQSGAVTATRDIALTVDGDALATGALTATNGQVGAAVGNDASFASVTAGTDILIAAGNAANFTGAIDAGTDFAVTSGANTTLGSTVLAGNDVSLAVGGGTFVNGTVAAGRDFTVAGFVAGDGTTSYTQSAAVTAARDIALTVDGDALATGALTATDGQVGATIGGDAGFAAVSAGTDILIDALGNATFGGALTADGDIGLTAGGTLAVRAGATAGDDYQLTASAITLGTAGQAHMQSAVGRVLITASTGDILGLGSLTLRSNANGAVGGGNLELLANLGAVNFGTQTALVAGLAGGTSAQRSSVFVTSAPGVTLGNVTAFGLATSGSTALTAAGTVRTGNLLLDSALTVTATGGAIVLGDATVRGPGAVIQLAASGATGDVTTGALVTDRGDILVSAARAIDLGSAATALTTPATPPVAGAIGLLAGGTIAAGALFAGDDIAARATGAITVTSAQAGDDIDFASTAGAIALGTGTARGASLSGTSLAFGTPGLPGSLTVLGGEDVQLAGSAIRLTATIGDVTSATQLTTTAGDVIVNAGRDVSLAGVAAGGSIAVRAGRDVVQATTLTATTGDIAVGAGGDAVLGTLTAGDDIDLTVAGNVRWTALQSLAGPDAARYVDVVSGSAGTPGGVTFGLGDDLALAGAAVVRITAGSVGDTTAGPLGLIAQNVTTGLFNAHAVAGDIRIGTVTASGSDALLDEVTVTADTGSVTGLPTGYAAATGGSIAGADSVLLTVAGSAAIGAITAGAVTGGADTLRIGTVTADSVGLSAVQTLDLGTVVAGTVDLTTTGGAPAAGTSLEILSPATALTPGFGAANLQATAPGSRIVVSAGGVAQLGTLLAGTLVGPGGGDQIVVDARALTVTQARAFDGALALTARDGLLRLDTGQAAERISLVKRNDDGASLGSDLITDILDAGTLQAGHGIAIRSATSARVASATAGSDGDLDRHIFLSAAKAITVGTLDAQQGSIGLLAGTTATATTLTAAEDVAVQAGTGITVGRADTGDDIDMVALTGTLTLTNATPSGSGLAAHSVSFAGGTIAVTPGEDAQLAGTTIRLRAATGDIASTGTLTAVDDLLANAAGDVSLATARASAGSIGLLAGGDVRATSLRAAIDIGIQAGTGIVVGTARADDDIDLLALTGDIALTSASTDALPFGTPGTSVIMPGLAGSAGAVAIAGGEDAQLAPGATIRLRAAAGDVTSTGPLTTLDATGTRNDILLNAAGDVSLTQVTATSSSIGILAGGAVTGTIFVAGIDIGVQGGASVTIAGATAGDDIDVTALTGTLSLTNASAGIFGSPSVYDTAVTFAAPGTAGAVAVATTEDPALSGSSIRLRAATGDVTSTGTLETLDITGNIFVNAAGDAALATATANFGSIGVLAGGQASATQLTADHDIAVQAGTGVTIDRAEAGDDIDMVALAGTLALTTGIANGLGTSATALTFGTAGAANAIVEGPEGLLPDGWNIRLRAAAGDIVSTDSLASFGDFRSDILINASGDARLTDVYVQAGSIGVLAGGLASATSLDAGYDIAVQAGSGITVGSATANDDIDMVALTGTLSLAPGLSTGADAADTSTVRFTGAAGTAGALTIGAGEDAELANASIRLRAATGDVISTGTLRTQSEGDVLVNAAGDVALNTVTAAGAIGVLAGRDASATTLTALSDIGLAAGRDARITTATAGDDIDAVAGRNLALATGISLASPGTGSTSVTLGTAGALHAVTVTAGEDSQLTRASIRLRAASGSIAGTLTPLLGTTLTTTAGDILLNAGTNATVLSATAGTGSIGVLAGGRVDATTLTASRDIGVQGGTGVTIATARAGDDIDVVALAGTLALTNGTATGLGAGGTSVLFGGTAGTANALGIGAEDAQLTGATMRLRAATGDVVSAGTLAVQGVGEVLVNASGDANLATVTSGGSIGLLAGDQVNATTLTAGRDIGVQGGTGVTIASATAGDDIDVVALTGTLALTNGTATGLGTGGTSVTTVGAPGTAAAVGIATSEDPQLTGASIRLRAAAGDITSTGTLLAQRPGEVLINASGNAGLNAVTATAGSIGLLAGGRVDATTLTAGRDIGVQAGTGVTIATADAGDDIDVVALAGTLALTNATSTGLGAGGTAIRHTAAAGTAAAVGIGSEETQLTGATVRLRSASGDILSTGTLRTRGTGEILVNAAGDAALATVTADAGSIGLLAGGRVDATTLSASRDIGIQGGTGVTIATATAGDDIDVVALAGTLALTNGTSTGPGTSGTSVLTTAAPGTAGAVGIGAEDAQLTGASIRLRAATGDVTSTGTLAAQGTGEVLVNASGNATLATVTSGGSIGLLAGGAVTATTLTASRDIGVQGGTGVTIAAATAGDDIDVLAVTGDLALTDATSTEGGAGTTSVGFGGTAGALDAIDITVEDPQLTAATIRLRAASGDILSTGTLLAQGTGELLLNASGDAALATTTATAGSIGVLAGGRVDAATLTASRDIGVQSGTGMTIASATAGDDIDVVALAGTVTLTDGTAAGAGAGGTSVRFGGTAGLANAVGIGSEDSKLSGSTIRLLAASGDIASTGTLAAEGNGDVLANASGNAALATVTSAGSIGVLAGGAITVATLTAGHDIGVQGGTGVTIASARAGDDIDVVALAGTVALTDAASTGAGAGGASVQFGGAPGIPGAVSIGAEDAQLTGATIHLRAAGGNVVSTGTLAAQGAGEVLVNASGNANLATVTSGGSIGVLAGGRVDATTLTASRDIGVQAGTGVTIAAATAGDDIDVLVATGDLALTNATSSGVGTGATSLIFSGTAGAANAIGIGSEDAQLSAATIRLRTADGDILSTGTLLAQGAGEVLVNASGNATLAAVTTNAGSIGVLAGGRVDATTLTASRDIGVQGGTGVTIATATAGDDIDVAALAGTVTLTDGTATAAGASGTSVRFGGMAGLADAVGIGGEDAQLSGATIRLRAASGNLVSTGTLLAQGAGEVLVNASGDANLAAVTSGGSIGVLAGGAVTATTLTASRDIGVQAGTGVTIATATAGDDIDVVALGGDLSLGRGFSTALAGSGGSSVLFAGAPDAGGSVGIGGEDAQLGGAAIRLRAAAGNVVSATSLAAQGTGDVLVNAAGSVRLASASTSLGSLGVLAGTRVDAAGLVAGGDVVVRAGTGITVGTAQAGDDIDMVALAGNLALTDGLSAGTAGAGGSSVVFTGAAGSLAALGKASGEDAQLGGATIRLRAAGGNVASTGTLETRGAGDVLVNAKGDVALATTRAGAGSVALLAGGALTAATTSASEDVAVRAATNAALTTITAGDDIAITAGGLVTTGTASIGGSASGLDARHTVFDAAQAGQAAGTAFVAGDPRGAASLPTGSALAAEANARSIVIEAANVDLQGALTNTAGRIVLRNTGANPTVVGDATVTTGATFALSNAELGRLRGASVVVDAGTRALELGTLTLDAATGTADTRFLSTGAVEITGPVTVAGTAERTLQIGGLLGELGDDAGAEPLATSIIARIDRATAPKIDAGSAHVELRGEKILFGTGAMVDEYIGKTNAEIALIVANPASKLYSEAAAQPLDVFLTAKRVTVGYKNFALFQNTDINRSTGVLINAPVGGVPDQTALALRLISTGESGNNSFAMFGVVNGLQGSTAALLTNQSVEIVNPTGNLNDFRVTRASSRLNGCVIGAPDRGCLSTDVPQPNFNFYDERRIALFDVDDQSTIAISPLIGRGNDGLIVNVADAPVGIDTIECRSEDPTCPAKEGQ
jgi:filamentous hemagglutinin family protein